MRVIPRPDTGSATLAPRKHGYRLLLHEGAGLDVAVAVHLHEAGILTIAWACETQPPATWGYHCMLAGGTGPGESL